MQTTSPAHLRLLARCVRRRIHASGLGKCDAIRNSSTSTRQWSTPLAKSLAEAITTTGPVSIANYMRQCLTSPEGGYYTTQAAQGGDQFGKSGDFVTSPEISQIFGELVGIWFVAEWMVQGRRSAGVEIIELGPGRGTLMADVLRTIANFKPMAASIDAIYLVEASPTLREAQRKLLCGDAAMEAHECGFQSTSKSLAGTKIVWTEELGFISGRSQKTPFIVAHEFFDALPFHAFQSSPSLKSKNGGEHRGITTSTHATRSTDRAASNEWRELVVSPTPPPSVINPPKTPGPEFQLTVSTKATPYSRLLPSLSPRYTALLGTPGATIEICPSARTITEQVARLVGGGEKSAGPSGAALFIDYGPSETIPASTLRGIRAHRPCSPFEAAGRVDLSADVDFGALAEAALGASEGVEVYGPVEQGTWLGSMGGKERSEVLVRKARAGGGAGEEGGAGAAGVAGAAEEGEGTADRITTGWRRLVDRGPNGMGRLYKVMAVVPASGGARRPVGFGGDVDA